VRGAGMRGRVNDSVYVRENNRACIRKVSRSATHCENHLIHTLLSNTSLVLYSRYNFMRRDNIIGKKTTSQKSCLLGRN